MLKVIFRQRAYAVGAEELVLIEHVGQNALQFLFVTDRRQPAPCVPDETLIGYCDLFHHLRMPLTEQLNQFDNSGMVRNCTRLEYGRGTQRQQSYQRADLQTHRIAIREMEQIVEEPIRRVPHLVVVHADAVHGVGDPYEMLEESKSNLLIPRVVLGQNERDLQHTQAIERHPCRAVGLVQMSAGGQRRAAIEYPNVVEPKEAAREHVTPLGIFAVDPPVEIPASIPGRSAPGNACRTGPTPSQFCKETMSPRRGPADLRR